MSILKLHRFSILVTEDPNLETSLWALKRFVPVQVVFSDSFLLHKVQISGSTGAVLIGHR
jgi:hypothetical protein